MIHPAQQDDRVNGRTIGLVAIVVVVVSVIGVLVVWALGAGSLSAATRTRAHDVPANPAAIETAPYDVEAQGIEINQRAEAFLSSYGWVDRERGIVHVPIGVAAEIYLARRAAGAVSAKEQP